MRCLRQQMRFYLQDLQQFPGARSDSFTQLMPFRFNYAGGSIMHSLINGFWANRNLSKYSAVLLVRKPFLGFRFKMADFRLTFRAVEPGHPVQGASERAAEAFLPHGNVTPWKKIF